MTQTKQQIIEKLRAEILLKQGYKPLAMNTPGIAGLGQIEAAFPNGVLPMGMLHEFICGKKEDLSVSGGFVAGLIHALAGKESLCLWVSTKRALFPPALKAFGLEPHQIIFIDANREKEVLWIVEEALKCSGFAAVIAELRELSFPQSRRLQLAVEQSHVTGFILRTDAEKLNTTACASRWQITALPTEPEPGLPGVGFPRWQVELLKVRNGQPGSWPIEWRGNQFFALEDNKAVAVQPNYKIRNVG